LDTRFNDGGGKINIGIFVGEVVYDNRMRVVVGSNNPVKVGSVRKVFEEYFSEVEVEGIEVESGVAEQPMSEQETVQGARQRAYGALRLRPEAEFGVGIEGGVTEINPTNPSWTGIRRRGRLFECAWVAVVKKRISGKKEETEEGLGGGLYFELPSKVAEMIRKGGELGPIMQDLLKYDVKRNEGAIGVFSKGKLSRQGAYEQLVKQALIKFVSSEWFVS